MRLKEFSIRKYGPLTDSGIIRLNDFNLFWGENEDGKTLTLEALIRMLLGRVQRLFSGIDRVNEKPEGYLILQNERGEEFKLPDAGQVPEFLGLSADEYRNLFIIRNSDLSIARETEFYGDVTERLTGLRTNQTQKIKENLRSLGFFTEGMDIINNKQSNYLKNRITQAKDLLEEFNELIRIIQEEGFDVLEESFVNFQNQLRRVEDEITDLERARLKEKFESGKQHLEAIRENLENLEIVKDYHEEELNKWQNIESFVEEKTKEKEQVNQQLQSREEERQDTEKKLEKYKSQFHISQKRKTDIEEKLRPLFRKWNDANELFARRNAGKNYFKIITSIFLIFSVLTTVGLYREPQLYMMLIAIAAGTITFAMALFYYFRFVKPQGELKQMEQNIFNRAGELGLPGDTIPQIQEQIQRFEENLQRQQQRVSGTEGRLAYLKYSCRSLRKERLAHIETRLTDARQSLRIIQAKQNVEAVEIYRERLWQRREYEQNIKESMTTLKSLFGIKGENMAESIKYWQAELQDLREYKDIPVEIEFNEKLLEKKKTSQKEIQEKIDELHRRLRDFRDRLADLERRTRGITLPDEELLPCRSLNDLYQLKQYLQDYLKNFEHHQQTTRTAIEILEEIEQDEKQKVSILFGEDSSISHRYEVITEGLYPAVHYESDTASIKIKRRDGKFLPAAWLSSGAYDQLYFVIRMALSEKLLRNRKGFFILDDPFVKSDGERLRRQLEVLLDFSQRGWQIIYFSAKDEVRTVLQKYIEQNKVNLQPVPGVEYKKR
jgi:uncharacterized protein YhaN